MSPNTQKRKNLIKRVGFLHQLAGEGEGNNWNRRY